MNLKHCYNYHHDVMSDQRVLRHRLYSVYAHPGGRCCFGNSLLFLMILVYTVTTAYSFTVDPTPARENSNTSKMPTMMSDHNEELDDQVIIFDAIPDQIYGRAL
jgi:hypothetical protein